VRGWVEAQGGSESADDGLWVISDSVLPDAQDGPFCSFQILGYDPISNLVGSDLRLPELAVRDGDIPAAAGAAVPKTSVKEYSDFLSPKDEVGFSEH
jgi:hypothetical protein